MWRGGHESSHQVIQLLLGCEIIGQTSSDLAAAARRQVTGSHQTSGVTAAAGQSRVGNIKRRGHVNRGRVTLMCRVTWLGRGSDRGGVTEDQPKFSGKTSTGGEGYWD